MIFKSISNAAYEVTGFFDLYEGCIPRVIKILLMKFYFLLIATFKPCLYSLTNYILAPTFGYSHHMSECPAIIPSLEIQNKHRTTQPSSHCYEENHQSKMQNYVCKNKSLSLTHDLTPGFLLPMLSIIKYGGTMSIFFYFPNCLQCKCIPL